MQTAFKGKDTDLSPFPPSSGFRCRLRDYVKERELELNWKTLFYKGWREREREREREMGWERARGWGWGVRGRGRGRVCKAKELDLTAPERNLALLSNS